jgi:Sulfatase
MIAFVGLVLPLLSVTFGNKKKIALVVSLFLVAFFSYGHCFSVIEGVSLGGFEIGTHRYLLFVWAVLFALGTYLVVKLPTSVVHQLTTLVTITASVLVIISIGRIVSYEFGIPHASNNHPSASYRDTDTDDSVNRPAESPDIYYIILDGHASARTLKELYDYDLATFEKDLTDRGFYVASRSGSNYAETWLSLASSLNMSYLSTLAESVDKSMLDQLVQENRVVRFLKSRGYRIVNVSSNVGRNQRNKYADWNVRCGNFMADEFQSTLIQTTVLDPLREYLNIAYFYRNKILCTLSTLGEVQHRIDGPRFVFAHILLPHPPYVFGPNAEPVHGGLTFNWQELWGDKDRYVDQVIFIDKMIKDSVKKILSEADAEPVIVIQGDHGPQFEDSISAEEKINARMRILNAYHLPKNGAALLYESITPVNTFRVIFKHYFHANYDLLEDKSYYSDYSEAEKTRDPSKFQDVSHDVLMRP